MSAPLVSVVMPVYNTGPYLRLALDSCLDQGLDPGQLEVVMVDDGSTDGSERVVDEYAAAHEGFRAIHQPNSGGPGGARNPGIEAATGRYIFFLDADDELFPGALAELVEVAEREGSEIVLGKIEGAGGRRAPQTMFHASVMDADLVTSRIINTLTSEKLFRTDLIRRTGARFPTDMRVGEDQPFTMRLYLAASKISVCADRSYVLLREREDASNITFEEPPADAQAAVVRAVVDEICAGTEPGELRDALFVRPLRMGLPPAVGPLLLELPRDEQGRLIEDIAVMLRPIWNQAVAEHPYALVRTKLELALADEKDLLREVIAWEAERDTLVMVPGADGFRLDLPADLAARIGPERLHQPPSRAIVRLNEIAAEPGGLQLDVTAFIRDAAVPADEVALDLVSRQGEMHLEVPLEDLAPIEVPETLAQAAAAVAGHARIDLDALPLGAWDAWVIQRFHVLDGAGARTGEVFTKRSRLGSERAQEAQDALAASLELHGSPSGGGTEESSEPEHLLGIAYGTEGYGNLSIDLGFQLKDDPWPDAEILAAVTLADGSAAVLLACGGTQTPRVLSPAGAEPAGVESAGVESAGVDSAGRELPAHAAAEGLLAVTVPADQVARGPQGGQLELVLAGEEGQHRVLVELAAPLEVVEVPLAALPEQPAPEGGLRRLWRRVRGS